MRFPVYALAKDCSEVKKYDSLGEMQKHLEPIDIENHEYDAWDADGTALELGAQKPVWISIKEGQRDRAALISALRRFAVLKGVEVNKEPDSADEIEALLRLISGKRRNLPSNRS